jgi:hypothetical protein
LLHECLSQQHHRLRTFQQKLATLSRDEPGQWALCRLLSLFVGGYIDAFDEGSLPGAVADRAYQRLLDLVASPEFRASAEDRLANLDRVAASICGTDCVKHDRAGPQQWPGMRLVGLHGAEKNESSVCSYFRTCALSVLPASSALASTAGEKADYVRAIGHGRV